MPKKTSKTFKSQLLLTQLVLPQLLMWQYYIYQVQLPGSLNPGSKMNIWIMYSKYTVLSMFIVLYKVTTKEFYLFLKWENM